MNIWHAKLATGLGTIVLGLCALAFAQEQEQEQDSPGQEPPNKALLATEIKEGRKQNAAQMRPLLINQTTFRAPVCQLQVAR